MERIELFTRVIAKACDIIKANATLSAPEYRALNLLSDRKAISKGARNLINKIAETL